MRRAAVTTLLPAERPITARAWLRPSGDHRLDLDMGVNGNLQLSLDEIERVRQAFDAFAEEIEFESRRLSERTHAHRAFLGEF